jgi:predicted histidine transporter YuiF (NhaC family)
MCTSNSIVISVTFALIICGLSRNVGIALTTGSIVYGLINGKSFEAALSVFPKDFGRAGKLF